MVKKERDVKEVKKEKMVKEARAGQEKMAGTPMSTMHT